jgi:hypothetical protein
MTLNISVKVKNRLPNFRPAGADCIPERISSRALGELLC